MSDETKNVEDGGPAFPLDRWQYGMSLRDWYAGMAMQGLLAHSCDAGNNFIGEPADSVAHSSYKMADAMIERRKW